MNELTYAKQHFGLSICLVMMADQVNFVSYYDVDMVAPGLYYQLAVPGTEGHTACATRSHGGRQPV